MRYSALDTHETWQCLLSDIINSLELFPRPFSSYRAWLDGITPKSTSFCWGSQFTSLCWRKRGTSIFLSQCSIFLLVRFIWRRDIIRCTCFLSPLTYRRFAFSYHNLNRKVYLTQLEKIESTRPTAVLNDTNGWKKKNCKWYWNGYNKISHKKKKYTHYVHMERKTSSRNNKHWETISWFKKIK